MQDATPPWYVLTGGPCAGKTTTIDELARRGHPVLAEPARLIIDEQLAAGKMIQDIVGNPDWLPSVVRRSIALESEVPQSVQYFFDRALPDSLAYYALGGRAIDDFFREALDKARYRKVFLLDLVDYTTDAARSETPEQAQAIHAAIRAGYEGEGYEVVTVPVLPVPERADFILERL